LPKPQFKTGKRFEAIDLHWLGGKSVFSALAPRGLKLVARFLKRSTHPPKTVLCWEGAVGDDRLFIVESGELEVLKKTSKKGARRIAILREGMTFGEMSLVGIAPRSATVRTLKKTITLSLSGKDLQKVYKKDSDTFLLFIMNLAREICRRLGRMNELVAEFNIRK